LATCRSDITHLWGIQNTIFEKLFNVTRDFSAIGAAKFWNSSNVICKRGSAMRQRVDARGWTSAKSSSKRQLTGADL
jgi:hypothetical protein